MLGCLKSQNAILSDAKCREQAFGYQVGGNQDRLVPTLPNQDQALPPIHNNTKNSCDDDCHDRNDNNSRGSFEAYNQHNISSLQPQPRIAAPTTGSKWIIPSGSHRVEGAGVRRQLHIVAVLKLAVVEGRTASTLTG